jgi:hypothetical protein
MLYAAGRFLYKNTYIVLSNSSQRHTTPHNATQRNTTQHNATQRNTTQHNATQRNKRNKTPQIATE